MKMKFTKAIVKTPCENMVKGLTTANLGMPDFGLAIKQHEQYIEALKTCGLEVTVLEADNNFPDSTFVEDVAVLTSECAIITNPGADSRKGETKEIENVLGRFYDNIEFVKSPGSLDGGDVMMAGKHFYIGISERTNEEGAQQLIDILKKHGMSGSMVKLKDVLHLKSGVAYLENNNLLASGEFPGKDAFKQFNVLKVNEEETYATNCVWINDYVLVAKGFPKTKQLVENAGYKTIVLDVSEFRKIDGGLSCLSLRF
jgi:dimethylargininase